MDQQPSKEQVRQWLQQRRAQPAPPPDIEQIRRELGWARREQAPAAQEPKLAA